MMIIMRVTILVFMLSLIGCISLHPNQAKGNDSPNVAQSGMLVDQVRDTTEHSIDTKNCRAARVAILPNAPSSDSDQNFSHHYFVPYWEKSRKAKYFFDVQKGKFTCSEDQKFILTAGNFNNFNKTTNSYPVIKLPKAIDELCKKGENSYNGFCILVDRPSTVEALFEIYKVLLRERTIGTDKIDINWVAATSASIPVPNVEGPQTLTRIISDKFKEVYPAKMKIDGCEQITRNGNQLQANNCNGQLQEKSLQINNFDPIPLKDLNEDKLNKTTFTLNAKLGDSTNALHFPIQFPIKELEKTLCVEVEGGKLCTLQKISAKQAADGNEVLLKFESKTPPTQPQPATGATGAYKLIVVALSKAFGESGRGNKINSDLKIALTSICANNIQKDTLQNKGFALLTIESGRQYNAKLSTTDGNFCSSQDLQLQFGAEDLKFVDDLDLVDSFIVNLAGKDANKKVGQILYLTGSGSWDAVSRKQLGIPLSWKNENIHLHVITTENCEQWKNRAQAECGEWKEPFKLAEEITSFLSRE